jgi:hypothetical protein
VPDSPIECQWEKRLKFFIKIQQELHLEVCHSWTEDYHFSYGNAIGQIDSTPPRGPITLNGSGKQTFQFFISAGYDYVTWRLKTGHLLAVMVVFIVNIKRDD